MDYNYFLNTYSFQPPVGFDTRKKQLKDAGVNTEECFMYGYGYYDCEIKEGGKVIENGSNIPEYGDNPVVVGDNTPSEGSTPKNG